MRVNSFTDKNKEAPLNPNTRIRAKFLFSLLWQNLFISICAFFSALMIALCDLLSIALIVPLIDSLRGGDKASEMLNQLGLNSLATGLNTMSILGKVRLVMIAFFVSQLLKSIFGYFVLILATRIEVNVDKNLKTTILNVLFSRSFQQIENKSIGSHFTLLYNYTNDTSFAARDLIGILPHIPTLIFYIITMLWLSWQLTVSSLICAGLIVYGIGYLNKALKDTGININKAYAKVNQSAYEILSSMKLIKLFNRESYFDKQFNNHITNLSDYKVRRGQLQAVISPLYNTMIALVLCITFIGASFIYPTDDTEWIQSALLLLIILFRLSTPVNAINERRARLISWGPSFDNIINFLHHKDRNIQKEGTYKFIDLNNDISFKNVSFRYSENAPHILKNLSFKIPKGKTTAIVGASGAGKSTLVNLVAGLYNPTKGTIEADSINTSDFTIESWHSRIGVVSQSTYLFNETIEDNVKFGKLDATPDEIKIACQQANADEFIQGMENKYQTVVGDNGIRLSGGQAQRIAIARAIIRNPSLIILDEATSSLDTESELLVQKALEEIGKHKTVLCIAHRLSTIINSDNILVLENGEIVEQGTYSYLIEKRGYFWQYAKLQNLN